MFCVFDNHRVKFAKPGKILIQDYSMEVEVKTAPFVVYKDFVYCF